MTDPVSNLSDEGDWAPGDREDPAVPESNDSVSEPACGLPYEPASEWPMEPEEEYLRGVGCQKPKGHDGAHHARVPGKGRVTWSGLKSPLDAAPRAPWRCTTPDHLHDHSHEAHICACETLQRAEAERDALRAALERIRDCEHSGPWMKDIAKEALDGQ